MLRSVACLLALGAAAPCDGVVSPPLPRLPTQFRATVNCNIVNKNYTVQVDEVYDFPNNRSLFTRIHPNVTGIGPADTDVGRTFDLNLYDMGERFHVNDTACVGSFTNSTSLRGGGPSTRGGAIPNSQQFFQFGPDFNESYVGRTVVNGIPCDHWSAKTGEWNSTSFVNITVDYFFSTPDWKFPTSNWTQVPVVVNMTGSKKVCTYGRGPPDCSSGNTSNFAHVYSYAAFHVGPIEDGDEVFAIPEDLNCTGDFTVVPRRPNQCGAENNETHHKNHHADGWSSDEIVETSGIALGSAMVGAVITAVIFLKMGRSSQTQSKHTSLVNKYEVTNPTAQMSLNDPDDSDLEETTTEA